MNRDQMIAWLTIEGWAPQQSEYWAGVVKEGELLYVFAEGDSRRREEVNVVYVDWGYPRADMLVGFDELRDLEILCAGACK